MVSPHGILLATHIISSSYGEQCSKVCDCLLRHGILSLAQIIRFTELTKESVVNCLRVLFNQNCVQPFSSQREGGFGEAPRIVTQYIVLFDNIIHKLRAPKFMQIVSEELGSDCLNIFHGLIQHGRLSLNRIIERNEQTTGKTDVQVLKESFNRLLNFRFIERCPSPEPFLAPQDNEEPPVKKRGARRGETQEVLTVEQRVLEAATPMESLRFLVDVDFASEEKVEETHAKVTLGKKRKSEAMVPDEDVMGAGEKKEVLWRVNYEEFVRRLRDKACISYVKTRLNDEASIVLSAILELSKNSTVRHKVVESAYLSINAIYDEVIKKDGGIGMDFDHIRASLAQLGCTCSSADGEAYSIDLKGITDKAQSEEVESVVLKRYGREAYRIFRLLSKAGRFLETDKISDDTFVEKKDTLKILYKLWKDDLLDMEKIMLNGGKQVAFLLWRVNKGPLFEKFRDEMYHAALNLRLRIIHEQEQAKEVRL
ncbi:DNA-directed RNA polymerase III subunit rpc3-like [Dorcoceras hygrometricum]|uniref:DNA-directed RNA polymerase III subunit RPC3 n=1 Tax=Dorcoceras hygrometricum TaxID=472368 RepID=A0A2Z7BPU4_9LAMI|nr:DNA-directed RNA polymerase III subunit rpc3-like [Dorcoceras hygrometricum]